MPSNLSQQQPHLPYAAAAATHPIVRFVAGFSRLLLHQWCASVQVRGLDRFLGLLRDVERQKKGQGILTYANHISVMDDPTIFGSLPKEAAKYKVNTRWTLGASDILFTNPLFSSLFKSGQVLPTDRGRGVYQPSIDDSIDLLENGQWVHMFPEGYVNLSRKALLRRFKWGIGRILLEAGRKSATKPIIVPMWISGLDAMMPEPRRYPRWFPRPGAKVVITFGDAINETMEPILNRLSDFATEQGEGDVMKAAEASLKGLDVLYPHYPSPPANSFPPITPLVEPPGGVPWPIPLPESRSSRSIEKHGDSSRAKIARSLVAAELRAHLLYLGERQGGNMTLAHQLMAEKLVEEEK